MKTLHGDDTAHSMTHRPPSRREFLHRGAVLLALPVLCACGSAAETMVSPGPPTATDAFIVDGDDVIISVGRVPSLARDNSAAVLLEARVIVVRVTAEFFRAFSTECPHAGCGVSVVDGARLLCPCHGSAFDLAGVRLEGPAPRGLTALAATFDRGPNTVRIRRG